MIIWLFISVLLFQSLPAVAQDSYLQEGELSGEWPGDWQIRYPQLFGNEKGAAGIQFTELIQLLDRYPDAYRRMLFQNEYAIEHLIAYYPAMREEIAMNPKLDPHTYFPNEGRIPPQLEEVITTMLNRPDHKAAFERRQQLTTSGWATEARTDLISYFSEIWDLKTDWPEGYSTKESYRFLGDLNADGLLTPTDLGLYRIQNSFESFREAWQWLQSRINDSPLPTLNFGNDEQDKSEQPENPFFTIEITEIRPHLDWLVELLHDNRFDGDPKFKEEVHAQVRKLLYALFANQESHVYWVIALNVEALHGNVIRYCAKHLGYIPDPRFFPKINETPQLWNGDSKAPYLPRFYGGLNEFYNQLFSTDESAPKQSGLFDNETIKPVLTKIEVVHEAGLVPAHEDESRRATNLQSVVAGLSSSLEQVYTDAPLTALTAKLTGNYQRFVGQDRGNESLLASWISQGLWLRTPASLVFNRTNVSFSEFLQTPSNLLEPAPGESFEDMRKRMAEKRFAKVLIADRQIEAFQNMVGIIGDVLGDPGFTQNTTVDDNFIIWNTNFKDHPERIPAIYRERHLEVYTPFQMAYFRDSYDYSNRIAHDLLDETAQPSLGKDLMAEWMHGYDRAIREGAKAKYLQALKDKETEVQQVRDVVDKLKKTLTDFAKINGLQCNLPKPMFDLSEEMWKCMWELYNISDELRQRIIDAKTSYDEPAVVSNEQLLSMVEEFRNALDKVQKAFYGDALSEHYEWERSREECFNTYFALVHGRKELYAYSEEKRDAVYRRLALNDDLDYVEWFVGILNNMIFMSYFDLNLDGRVDNADLVLYRGIVRSVDFVR